MIVYKIVGFLDRIKYEILYPGLDYKCRDFPNTRVYYV